MDIFLAPLRKTFVFSGRARRKEFFAYFLTLCVLLIIDSVMLAAMEEITPFGAQEMFIVIFLLVVLVPNFSLSVRRLHDSGLSGWWILIAGIPLGNLVFLWMMLRPGTTGPNKYGPDPRMAQSA